ncbi:MAG: LysR family transcriptional regulator [Pseudobdellovibrionaceae bacterium]|nr:LysR family transcriptional regulator [Pseudobdellovibrionaceae bacterium]
MLETGSVSQAARRLGLTQSAMSNALNRLREAFHDELLIRVGKTMCPTALALDLRPHIREIISRIEADILSESNFDPKTAVATLRLACHDYESLLILLSIKDEVVDQFPGISLEMRRPQTVHSLKELDERTVDFATGPVLHDVERIHCKKLFADPFVCLTSNQVRSLSLEDYLRYDHLFIAPHGGMQGQVDEKLSALGYKRRVRLSVADFCLVPWLIKDSSFVVTLPGRAARHFAEVFTLTIHPSPVTLEEVPIYLSWHASFSKSPLHRWFRHFLEEKLKS